MTRGVDEKVMLVAALLSMAGCGGGTAVSTDGGSDSNTSAGPTVAVACGDLAAAQCAKRMTCSGGNSVTRAYGTMAACVTRTTLACANGLGAPETGNSPSLVEECVAAFATYTCADFFNNNPPTPCAAIGPRPTGGACAFNGQCASGYCAGTETASCGTCAASPTPGASCVSSACGHGQSCVNSTMLCQNHGMLNASCDTANPCGNGLTCVGNVAATSTPGTCQPSLEQAGVPCGGTMPGCDGTLGLFCGGTAGSKTCMPITYVVDGMPCGVLSATSHAECIGGACYASAGLAGTGEMGACKADATDGAACDAVLGPACGPPARCVVTGTGSAGTCTIPIGATCG